MRHEPIYRLFCGSGRARRAEVGHHSTNVDDTDRATAGPSFQSSAMSSSVIIGAY